MKKVDYIQLLTDKDRVKIEFAQYRGKILKFVVQYYSLINSRWRTIIRIDNHHGFPHMHIYHLHKKEFRIQLDNNDNNNAFTKSKEHIIRNFKKIKENFIFN
ncbi:MAG: hypothetical protein UU71_C0021G0010 [Parcubacteria group bacterium GW2011_GWB1_41_6]|nr:MAG: hypothetical protein UU71_C0021G0010 [Parcubacteria group bacterium GW2011_GWB1_41_6]KKS34041.1 MAG: hypothetical protein UU96_C0009G0003 [Parcubacteria group bacterium GW2011_GWC2_42_13]